MWPKRFIKENLYFFYPFAACLFAGAIFLYLYPKDILLLAVNSRHSLYGDLFFKSFTHVGDGNTVLILTGLLLLFVSKEKGLVLGISYAVTNIPVQLVKNYAFSENYRPKSYFWNDYHRLHFTEGVEILVSNSFPSGHTATAFSMFLVLSYWMKNKIASFFFFIMAFMVGYSRMYLALHFFADVYAGALFAVLATSGTIYFLNEYFKLQDKTGLQKGFFLG